MFCSNCGAQSSEDMRFCGKCGSPIQQENQADHGLAQQSRMPEQQDENPRDQSQMLEQQPQGIDQIFKGKKWFLFLVLGVVFALGFGVALLISGKSDADNRAEGVPEVLDVVALEPETEQDSVDEVEHEAMPEHEDESSEELTSLTRNIGLANDDVFVMVNSEGYFGMLNGAGEVVVPFEFSNLSSSYYLDGMNYYFMLKYDESGHHGPNTVYYALDDSGNTIVRSEGHRIEMSNDGFIHTIFWNEDRVSTVWDLSGNILFSMNEAVFSLEGFSNQY